MERWCHTYQDGSGEVEVEVSQSFSTPHPPRTKGFNKALLRQPMVKPFIRSHFWGGVRLEGVAYPVMKFSYFGYAWKILQ